MEKMLYLNEYFQLGPLLNLARERPLLISGLVETYWRTRAEPVLDYVPGLWMRIDLFRRLQDNIKRHELSFVPSMTVFALFMVAPIDVLRSRLDNLERNAQEKNTAEVQEFIEQCRNTVAVIQEFVSAQARQVGGSGEDNSHLLHSMNLCKKRDRRKCSISRMENPEAVPIFPNTIHSPNLLSMIDTFWGTETAARLSPLIRDPVFLKSPQNMLSLNRQLSWWYQSGRIAFKPLRKTNTNSLVIQFHWLKKSKLEPAQLFTDDMDIWEVMEVADIPESDGRGKGINGWGRHHFDSYSGLGMETTLTDEANGDYDDHYGGYEDSDDDYRNGCRDEGYYDDQYDGGYDGDEMKSQPDMYRDKNYVQLRHWGQGVEGQGVEGQEVEGEKDLEENDLE
ncbi:hypothetical protein CI102_3652 [Trichoderma harzianum]|nr:hypothetical protein CI102_3652 [Trichoderma harzianum]